MLTRSQIIWASEHDWFVCDNHNGSITVIERYLNSDDEVFVTFESFRALRDWAGY